MLPATSAKGFQRKGWVAPAAGTRVMRRLVGKPTTAMTMVAGAMRHGSAFQAANRTPPPAMPSTMATNVLISSSALARERSRSREHFGDDAVLGGAEDGGVQPHEEDHEQHAFDPVGEQGGEAEEHDGDFEDLDADQHAALADGVGQVAGVAGEEQRGQDEDGAARAGRKARVGVADVEGDDGLIDVVVERAEELGPEEGLEAAVLEDVAESAMCHAAMSATELPIGGRG